MIRFLSLLNKTGFSGYRYQSKNGFQSSLTLLFFNFYQTFGMYEYDDGMFHSVFGENFENSSNNIPKICQNMTKSRVELAPKNPNIGLG